jgi:hypothetical protein
MKTRLGLSLVFSMFLCLIALPVFAEQIQIHITGLNFKYDGTDIFDSTAKAGGNYNTAQADPLFTIDFAKDGVFVGRLTAADNIFADLLIDNVQSIPKDGGMVTTGDSVAGFGLDLLQDTGDQTIPLLSLKINQLTLSYMGDGIYVSVGGLAQGVAAQNLPFDLKIDTHKQIKLVISSVDLSNVVNNGDYLSQFDALGVANITGTVDNNVPEPAASTALIGLAASCFLTFILRRRR